VKTPGHQVPWLPLLCSLLLSSAGGLDAQAAQAPLTFDWNASLQTIGNVADSGAGWSVDTQDAVSLGVELSHGAGPGLLSYLLTGEMQYTPQQITSGDPPITAFSAYPGVSGVFFELPSPRLVGLWFRAGLGRLALDEPAGLLLRDPDALVPAQLVDGLLVEFRYQGLYGSLGAGYLGLLEKRLNRVRFTAQDDLDLADRTVYFAPPRGLAVLRLEADNLFAGQRAGLFAIWQKDFRASGPTFDSWYFETLVEGPIASGFRHESALVAAVTVPSGSATGLGLLLDELIAYRLPVNFLHEAWFSVLWASGAGGSLAAFPALAGPSVSTGLQSALSDIVRLELGLDSAFSAAPAGATLSSSFAVRLLLRPSGQDVPGYSFSMSGAYVGTELELSARLKPVEGLTFRGQGGVLITSPAALPYLRLEAGVVL
jgi:hypothetical protein